MLAIELGGYVMGALGQRCLLKLKAAAELFGTEGLTSELAAETRKLYFRCGRASRLSG
jgi:hypothetical protein